MNWLTHGIDSRVLDYIFISLSVLVSVSLFGTSKLDSGRRTRRFVRLAEDVESRLQALEVRIEQIEKQLLDRPEVPAAAAASEMVWSGVNLTKRSKALRLHRRGAEANVICRTLGVVKGELALMVKIQKLISGGSAEVQK